MSETAGQVIDIRHSDGSTTRVVASSFDAYVRQSDLAKRQNMNVVFYRAVFDASNPVDGITPEGWHRGVPIQINPHYVRWSEPLT